MASGQECSVTRSEDNKNQGTPVEPMAEPSFSHENKELVSAAVHEISASLDGQSYFLGEVPQLYLADPHAFLPLNSDCLMGAMNMARTILSELEPLIEEELKEVSKLQRQISLWEEKIRRNSGVIDKNLAQIQQNIVDMSYDNKNRDFWCVKEQQVLADYSKAEASGSVASWAWLIKKYGLKNPDGTPIDHHSNCVGELCNGAASNLSMEYKMAGIRYDQTHKHKEADNVLLTDDNDKLSATNQQLQKYIANMFANEIEPLQDGVLLFKELGLKLKTLERQESPAKYGDLRSWAESFLDEFLKENSFVQQRVVNAFRRLASIPLPAQNS